RAVPSGCSCSRWCGWRRRAHVTGPHEDAVVLIHRQALTVNQLILEGLQVLVIQMELQLERAIRQTSAPLEHGHRLVEDLLKGHRPPPSTNAAYRRRCGNGTGHSGAVIPHRV